MNIIYEKRDYNRTIAKLISDDGENKCEILMFPLSIYVDRRHDIADPFVPYTVEMYFEAEQCGQALAQEPDETTSFFIKAVDTLFTYTPFRSIFFTVDTLLYEHYWNNVIPYLTSLRKTNTTMFDDDQTVEIVRHWPNFIDRFGAKKMTLGIRNEYIDTYSDIWWDSTQLIKE